MKQLPTFIVVLLLCTIYYGNSQGRYLSENHSGFGLSLGLSTDNITSVYQAAAAYSIKGTLDIGAGFSSGNRFTMYDFEQLRLNGRELFLRLHLAKEQVSSPLSMSIKVSRSTTHLLSNQAPNNTQIESNQKGFDLSLSMDKRLTLNDLMNLRPGLILSTGSTKRISQVRSTEITSIQNMDERTERYFKIGIELPLVFQTKNNAVAIVPAIARSGYGTAFSLALEVVFGGQQSVQKYGCY